ASTSETRFYGREGGNDRSMIIPNTTPQPTATRGLPGQTKWPTESTGTSNGLSWEKHARPASLNSLRRSTPTCTAYRSYPPGSGASSANPKSPTPPDLKYLTYGAISRSPTGPGSNAGPRLHAGGPAAPAGRRPQPRAPARSAPRTPHSV